MGLIKAGLGALGGTLADQWKEFFYCDSIPADTLMVRGEKKTTSRTSNTKGNDNVISNGSIITVANGQCMIIVEQGKVVELCAEPGEFTWDSSTEPSIFAGSLGESIKQTFKTLGKRFTFGGDTAKDQRVYYFNMKEIMDNKFGTPNPIPFRVYDANIGLDLDTEVRASGVYSYKISDPILFYTNVCGNVTDTFERSEIENQLKTEFISALQPAFARLSDMGIRPNQIPAHCTEIEDEMNNALSARWSNKRGLTIVTVSFGSVTIPEAQAEEIRQIQRSAVNRDPNMAGATIATAQADAMRTAAANENGAMTGFMGMGMAMNQGSNAQNLFAMGQQQNRPAQTNPNANANTWKCSCGAENVGKFCTNCGGQKPVASGWTCSCGAVNKGNFCSNCGGKKPAEAPIYKCDKCGWEPEDSHNPPKFCPNCGDVFDSNDIK